jgi:hypothetical protein
MKTIIKIIVAIVVLVGCFNAGWAAWNNFQFEDAAQQALLFETRANDAEVVNIVMKIASEYAIPLTEDDISVRMIGQDRVVEMSYVAPVRLIPSVYTYNWEFTPRTSTRILK